MCLAVVVVAVERRCRKLLCSLASTRRARVGALTGEHFGTERPLMDSFTISPLRTACLVASLKSQRTSPFLFRICRCDLTFFRTGSGVVSNISQCHITFICSIARARSRSLVRFFIYAIFISSVTVTVRFNNSHMSRKSRTAGYLAMTPARHSTAPRVEPQSHKSGDVIIRRVFDVKAAALRRAVRCRIRCE